MDNLLKSNNQQTWAKRTVIVMSSQNNGSVQDANNSQPYYNLHLIFWRKHRRQLKDKSKIIPKKELGNKS